MGPACGGTLYFPSRCIRSILLRPKLWILTSAWEAEGRGLGISGLRNRDEMGPVPFLMSVMFSLVGGLEVL